MMTFHIRSLHLVQRWFVCAIDAALVADRLPTLFLQGSTHLKPALGHCIADITSTAMEEHVLLDLEALPGLDAIPSEMDGLHTVNEHFFVDVLHVLPQPVVDDDVVLRTVRREHTDTRDGLAIRTIQDVLLADSLEIGQATFVIEVGEHTIRPS